MTAFTPAMSPSLNRSLTSFPRPLTSLLGEEGLVTLHPRRLSITPLFLSLPCRAAAQSRRYNQGRAAALVGSDWFSSASCTVSRLTWGA